MKEDVTKYVPTVALGNARMEFAILKTLRMIAYAQGILAYSAIEDKDGWEIERADLGKISDSLKKLIEL